MTSPLTLVKALAEGKILCRCGNRDWEMFFYAGCDQFWIAACKLCVSTYHLENNQWLPATNRPIKEN